MRNMLSGACLTVVLGLPITLAAIIWGGQALLWILQHLPQN